MIRGIAALLATLACVTPLRADDAGPGPADAGAPEEAVEATRKPLSSTASLDDLRVAELHVVLERKGDRMEVVETITLASRDGTRFTSRDGVRFDLPKRALAPKAPAEVESDLAVEARADRFLAKGPVTPQGGSAIFSFEVPIAEGSAAFEQLFPVDVGAVQVISTWTRGGAELRVEGCGDAVRDELNAGLTALIAMRQDLAARTLSVTLSGIDSGASPAPRRVALALCLGLFALGAAAAVRNGRRGARREPR